MRMSAADFHDAVAAIRIDRSRDFACHVGDQLRIAEFVDVFHLGIPSNAANVDSQSMSACSARYRQSASNVTLSIRIHACLGNRASMASCQVCTGTCACASDRNSSTQTSLADVRNAVPLKSRPTGISPSCSAVTYLVPATYVSYVQGTQTSNSVSSENASSATAPSYQSSGRISPAASFVSPNSSRSSISSPAE